MRTSSSRKTWRRQWPPPKRHFAEPEEGRLLNFLRLLAQGREVDHRAAHQGRRYLEVPLPRRDGSEDVVVFTQLHWSHSGVPVEDLQVPGTARIADLGWNEVEHVAVGSIVRQSGQQTSALHDRNVATGVDDMEDDVALADQLCRIRRRGDLCGGLVLDDPIVVET